MRVDGALVRVVLGPERGRVHLGQSDASRALRESYCQVASLKRRNAHEQTGIRDPAPEDGYTEIEAKSLQPRPANDEHGHPFAVRGLVLSGAFTVTQRNATKTYRPGEDFSVAAGLDHSERIGPEGAEVVVGHQS